jgi:hypothetical protein
MSPGTDLIIDRRQRERPDALDSYTGRISFALVANAVPVHPLLCDSRSSPKKSIAPSSSVRQRKTKAQRAG